MLGFTITRKKKEDEEELVKGKGEEKKETRKRKKEPPKPWGRVERVIVFSLFGSTILVSSLLALSARNWKLSGVSFKFLPNFSFHKTYILEKPTNEDFSIPIGQFEDLVADKAGVYSFFVARVYRDNSYGYRQYEEFESDSLVQLALLWQVFNANSNGDITLSKDYVITRTDKIGETGLKPYSVGSTLSYRELAGMMCAVPDLSVEKIFIDVLGAERMQNLLQDSLSFSTNIKKHTTTTADIGFMLKRIVESETISSEAKDDFVDCLRKNDNNEFERIFNSQFVYKYNINTRQGSVAGIVFAPKPYVVVIMGEGTVESETSEVLPAALQIIAQFEN